MHVWVGRLRMAVIFIQPIHLGWFHTPTPRHKTRREEKSRERRGVDWVEGLSTNPFSL